MAVSADRRNTVNWSDELGLLPLFVTLVLPLVIGVIVILKCVFNHCCLRKTTTKSYTVKPTLRSWRGREGDEISGHEQPNPASNGEQNDAEPTRSGSVRVPVPNVIHNPSLAAANNIQIAEEDGRPIPPRRSLSGQWRRSIAAQNQLNSTNDNQVNFSGDSQDSRGYTQFSGRGPNMNQNTRRDGDPHYVTVSDDSEEMYAAIEDGEGNYMRIPGDDARHWQAERREANSPLPPVPPPISPVLLMSSAEVSAVNPSAELLSLADPTAIVPPIYAQVTKVKKSAPTNPSSFSNSAASTSTSSQAPVQINPSNAPNEPPLPLPVAQPSLSLSNKRTTHHHNHSALILEATDGASSEARRWSKADINYSEFEVIREPLFPSTSTPKAKTASASAAATELIDEDNYNIVPEVRTTSRLPSRRRRPESVPVIASSRTLPHPSSSANNDPNHPYAEISKPPPLPPLDIPHHPRTEDGYSELAKRNSFASNEDDIPLHPYTELTKRSSSRSPTGYYQEIGDRKPNQKRRNNLYQKIRRKGTSAQADESEDEDEDEEDQFYEKVKSKAPPPLPPPQMDLPNHANPSALKHGYEKIKPKGSNSTAGEDDGVIPSTSEKRGDSSLSLRPNPTKECNTSTVESDEDGSMYEQVKYTPPYERLKESAEELDTHKHAEKDGSSEDNLYEDISYSRIRKSTETRPKSSTSQSVGAAAAPIADDVDVNNLYARVDKTKKKRNTIHH